MLFLLHKGHLNLVLHHMYIGYRLNQIPVELILYYQKYFRGNRNISLISSVCESFAERLINALNADKSFV